MDCWHRDFGNINSFIFTEIDKFDAVSNQAVEYFTISAVTGGVPAKRREGAPYPRHHFHQRKKENGSTSSFGDDFSESDIKSVYCAMVVARL